MKVARWGNSLAVRLPRSVVQELGLREGDEVHVAPSGPRRINLSRDERKQQLLARIREISSPLPADYTFDRDEANAR